MNIKTLSSHRKQEPENGILYLVGTPIGNLSDLSFRAINILKNVSLIACEDTRQTKKIMQNYAFKNNLISFNKHNSIKKIPKIISDLQSGKSIALVSDAGMPSICDPGEELVKKVKLNGSNIICIPGPCAVITALVSSGMPSSNFVFHGFLPKKKSDKSKILEEISLCEKTSILFESPNRLKRLLKELREFSGGERQIQVFRELTKKFEEHIGNNLNMVINSLEEREVIGEITIVIEGIKKVKDTQFDVSYLKKDLHELVKAGLTRSAASKYLAKKNGVTKSIIYNLY